MFLKSAKGQIAIFVVLIFQVLFILFALTINIGLVVHDKINLQNSLDLATYYGAKKQAEVLNAMAHINYQMRQNWKLLAWRYRILGTLLQGEGYFQENPQTDYWCPQNSENRTDCKLSALNNNPQLLSSCQSDSPYPQAYCDTKYFTCISHSLWQRGVNNDGGQNICEKSGVTIPSIPNFNMVAGFMVEAHLARRTTITLQDDVGRSCPMEGALNWLMVQMFLTHFRLDQKDRKTMLREIFAKTLAVGKDLERESIFEGAQKVFLNNLTSANRKNVETLSDFGLTQFNSFQNKSFEDIFESFNVFPILQFLDAGENPGDNGGCNASLKSHLHILGDGDPKQPTKQAQQELQGHPLASFANWSEVEKLFINNISFSSTEEASNPLASLSLGFSKKRDQTLYYGLRAEFEYQSQHQVFSLNLSSGLNFKASAFAKAFGGRFGPKQRDPLIPEPSASESDMAKNIVSLQPNYSRWPGDRWGLIDRGLHDNNQNNPYSNFLNKHGGKSYDKQRVYTMEAFFHLVFYPGTADDPLARPVLDPNDDQIEPFTFMRMMELMALYPDIYDLSYYSILGNYHQTYFPKICQILKGSECQKTDRNEFRSSISRNTTYIRGDFGWPETEDFYLPKNREEKGVELSVAPYFLKGQDTEINMDSINLPPEAQGKTLPAKQGSYRNNHLEHPLTQGRFFYPWLAQEMPGSLLSSWMPTTQSNRYEAYVFPAEPKGSFMKCPGQAILGMPSASACAYGGRSGYSVKLVSCETVSQMNPKPSNLKDFCP